MNNTNAIFIFTKDRPFSLSNTLHSIKFLQIKKYIIDDSFDRFNQAENVKLTRSISDAKYIGKKEFDNYFLERNINVQHYTFLLNNVGNKEWNLGYVRTFALLVAKSQGINKVLFMDDDILIPQLDIVIDSFNLLNNYDFVGAHITGMLDDSIIGHISSKLGVVDEDERMLSGGFLAFNPQIIKIPFTNLYNEDWIWLFLQLKDKKYLQKGNVIQSAYNPFLNFKEKILFQEFGEIVILGMLKLYKQSFFEMLTHDFFWENVLAERKEFLNKLYDLSAKQKQLECLSMIDWVRSHFSQFNSKLFQESFNDFFNATYAFQDLCELRN